MDKYELLRLVKNPTETDPSQSADIRKMIREYPYFQLLYTLNAKTAPLSHHTREASVRVADRKLLKRILTENFNPNAEKDLTERAGEVNAFELLAEPETSEEPVVENAESGLSFEEPAFDAPDFMGEQAKAEDLPENKEEETEKAEPFVDGPDNFFEGLHEKAPLINNVEDISAAEEPAAESFELVSEEVVENEPITEEKSVESSGSFFDDFAEEPAEEVPVSEEKVLVVNSIEPELEEVVENEPIAEEKPAENSGSFFDDFGDEPAEIPVSEEKTEISSVNFFENEAEEVVKNESFTEDKPAESSGNFFDDFEEPAAPISEEKEESPKVNFFETEEEFVENESLPEENPVENAGSFFDDFDDEPEVESRETIEPITESVEESPKYSDERLAENGKEEELASANNENADKESATNFFDDAVEDFFADKEDINTETPPVESPVEQDLIDKFIREEPRLQIDQERAKSEDRDIWEERKTEEDFPATERLAKIFEEQGHIERAIVVYQKLQLKFPEKSAYFADRIEKLNTL